MRSTEPSPYAAAVSIQLIGLAKAFRIVCKARSVGTSYPKTSGMLLIGPPPMQRGVTCNPDLVRLTFGKCSTMA